jgi:hypothetical protein
MAKQPLSYVEFKLYKKLLDTLYMVRCCSLETFIKAGKQVWHVRK